MEEAILEVHFPRLTLPSRGFRCPVCHHERLLWDDAERLEETARRLGVFGMERPDTRTLLKVGGSIAVTLDPELAREVLGTIRPGTHVRVGRHGGRIVIEPVKAGKRAATN